MISVFTCIYFTLIITLSTCDLLSSFNQRGDDATSVLQSAFETAGIPFSEQTSPPTKRTPKPSIFSKYGWRFRFPFRSLTKDASRILYGSGQSIPKPLKLENMDEHGDFQQMMNLYHRPQLATYPTVASVTGVRAPEYILQQHVQQQQQHQPMSVVDTITLKPMPQIDPADPQPMVHEAIFPPTLMPPPPPPPPPMPQSAPLSSSDHQYQRITEQPTNEMVKMRSIRYDYSGFKPIGPGTSSPIIYPAYSSDPYHMQSNQSIYSISPTPDASTTTAVLMNASDDGLSPRDGKSVEIPSSDSSESGYSSGNLLYFPTKVEPDNKVVLPINPSDLLRLVDEESRYKDGTIECHNKDLGWCDYLEKNYPTGFVEEIIAKCQKSIDSMYVEVPANLGDYAGYLPYSSNMSDISKNSDSTSTTSTTESIPDPQGNRKLRLRRRSRTMCDSEKRFIKPVIAQDITGNWYLIVQASLYNQQVPVEICSKPGSACNKSPKCGSKTRCIQKFSTQLLISINLGKEKDCPAMKLYRFPSGCVCDVNQAS
ncbi:uncharacterized protein LOC141852524 [Brevipalpus obovatus]|uniref:uncharacterized protein LOC141852524 n=1 Tax=Brevipalpus obovatus TaxID=246614 RepID=UPI003D9F0B9D